MPTRSSNIPAPARHAPAAATSATADPLQESRRAAVRFRAAGFRSWSPASTVSICWSARAPSRKCSRSRRTRSKMAMRPFSMARSVPRSCRTRALNENGFRVIVVATREFAPGETGPTYGTDDEASLVVRGYLAFLDPPKETAKAALAVLRAHGVAVKILTGDNAVVTRRICDEVGLRVGSPSWAAISTSSTTGRALARRGHDRVRQNVAAAQVTRSERVEGQRPHRRLPGRWHHRRAGAARRRCRHLGRHRGRHRQGVGLYHSREEPDGARAGRDQGPRDLRQYHQVHKDDGELRTAETCSAFSSRALSCHSCRCCRFICLSRISATTSRSFRFPGTAWTASTSRRRAGGRLTTSPASCCSSA